MRALLLGLKRLHLGIERRGANYGLQLLVANALQPDPRYRETAADNLHYLLGRNTFSLSWVTQVGANPFRHPHHRPSGADQNPEPWPGLLAGGPNGRRTSRASGQRIPGYTRPVRRATRESTSRALSGRNPRLRTARTGRSRSSPARCTGVHRHRRV